MKEIIHFLEEVVSFAAQIGITLTEMAGIAILLITVVKAIIGYFRKSEHLRLDLAEGIALALEFKIFYISAFYNAVFRYHNEIFVFFKTVYGDYGSNLFALFDFYEVHDIRSLGGIGSFGDLVNLLHVYLTDISKHKKVAVAVHDNDIVNKILFFRLHAAYTSAASSLRRVCRRA